MTVQQLCDRINRVADKTKRVTLHWRGVEFDVEELTDTVGDFHMRIEERCDVHQA